MNIETMPDLSEAIARLDAAEATETPPPAPAQEQAHAEPTETPAAPTSTDTAPKPNSISTDTPAAVDPTKPAEPVKKLETKQPTGNFGKDKQRRDDSWKALNAEKESFAKERSSYEALKAAHTREVEQFKVQQAKKANAFTPEQYEQAAQNRVGQSTQQDEQADAWEARAEQLENAGNFKGAEQAKANAKQLREQAILGRAQSKQFKEMADNQRRNPDPTLEQIRQKNDQQMRGYTLKAVEQWPEFGKQGSEFQKQVAQGLQDARKLGLEVNDNPALLYYAARLVAGETTAARVPAMEKELGVLRARVKELESFTAPGGGSASVQRQSQANQPLNDDQELEYLRQEAARR